MLYQKNIGGKKLVHKNMSPYYTLPTKLGGRCDQNPPQFCLNNNASHLSSCAILSNTNNAFTLHIAMLKDTF